MCAYKIQTFCIAHMRSSSYFINNKSQMFQPTRDTEWKELLYILLSNCSKSFMVTLQPPPHLVTPRVTPDGDLDPPPPPRPPHRVTPWVTSHGDLGPFPHLVTPQVTSHGDLALPPHLVSPRVTPDGYLAHPPPPPGDSAGHLPRGPRTPPPT